MEKKKSPPRRRRRRRRSSLRLRELPWGRVAAGVAVIGIIAAIFYRAIGMEEVQEQAERLPGPVAFALLVILPLLGVPASLLHVAAGLRFGAMLGFALVVASIALQLVASYLIVHTWRKHFEQSRWIERVRERIPKGAHAAVCSFAVLLPAAPFAAVNYTLALIGVPLRTLLLCALPLHALRATVTVAFGGQSAHLTGARLCGLLAYALLIAGASWWMYHRLQGRFASPPRAAGGRKQPA